MERISMWIIAIVLAIGSFFVNLYTFTKLWTLIVVPLGAPAIGMKSAYGIAMIVAHFTFAALHKKIEKEKDKDKFAESVAVDSLVLVLSSLISWGIASLVFG